MKKILILTNNDAGFYDFRKELITALVSRGDDVFISVPDTGFKTKLEKLGAKIIPISIDRRGTNPLKDIKLYKAYKQLIKDIKPDVALTYTIKPSVYGGVALRRAKIPYLVTITGLGGAVLDGGIMQKITLMLYKVGLKGAESVIFQNDTNMQFMIDRGCLNRRSRTRLVAGSGVNLEENRFIPYPEKSDQINLLTVGRIMNYKGSKELLEVAGPIHEKHPEVVFHMCGSYEEDTRDYYEPIMNQLIADGAVVHHGFMEDVKPFYGMCNAVVHPSLGEGISNVLLEATASGRPVLASDIPGCRETYEVGRGGFSYPMRNPQALEDTIEKFLALDFDAWKKMGENARKYIEDKFDRKQVIAAYLQEIDSSSNI